MNRHIKKLLVTIAASLLGLAAVACDGDDGGDPTTLTDGTGGTGGGSTSAPGGAGGSGGAATSGGGPVTLSGVFNARHTGGLPSDDGGPVEDFVLIRSGHLADLDATGCGQLSGLQIQSVIDLRAADAATATPDADCVMSSTAFYQADLPKILPPSESSYSQTLAAAEPELSAIFGHLSDNGLPAIVHCVIGRDRASLVMAILLRAVGVPEAQVLTDFTDNQDSSVTVEAAWLQAVFDEIEQAGGITAYLESHGVTGAQIDAIKDMALGL